MRQEPVVASQLVALKASRVVWVRINRKGPVPLTTLFRSRESRKQAFHNNKARNDHYIYICILFKFMLGRHGRVTLHPPYQSLEVTDIFCMEYIKQLETVYTLPSPFAIDLHISHVTVALTRHKFSQACPTYHAWTCSQAIFDYSFFYFNHYNLLFPSGRKHCTPYVASQ